MNALRVTLGSRVWKIALKDQGNLSAIVTCADLPEQKRKWIELSMGGLESESGTHIRWNPIKLSVGDSVKIDIIPDCDGSEPDMIHKRDRESEMKDMKQYVRDRAAELGWTISEEST